MNNTDNQDELWEHLIQETMSEFADSSHKEQLETILKVAARTDLSAEDKLVMIQLAVKTSYDKMI